MRARYRARAVEPLTWTPKVSQDCPRRRPEVRPASRAVLAASRITNDWHQHLLFQQFCFQVCGSVQFCSPPHLSHPMHSPFPTPLLSKPSFDALPSLGPQRLLTFSMPPPFAIPHNLALGHEAWPTDRPTDKLYDPELRRRPGVGKEPATCYCDVCDKWIEFKFHLYRKALPADIQDNRKPSRFECIGCYGEVRGISPAQAKSHFRSRVGKNRPERKAAFEGSPNESPPKSA